MVNEHLVEFNISNREHVEVEWDVLLECAAHQEIHKLTSLIRCLGSAKHSSEFNLAIAGVFDHAGWGDRCVRVVAVEHLERRA